MTKLFFIMSMVIPALLFPVTSVDPLPDYIKLTSIHFDTVPDFRSDIEQAITAEKDGNYPLAITCYHNAIKKVTNIHAYIDDWFLFITEVAVLYQQTSEYDKSVEYYTLKKEKAAATGKKKHLIEAYLGLSGVNSDFGNHIKALENINLGSIEAADFPDKQYQIMFIDNRASIYNTQKEYKKAHEEFTKAFEFATEQYKITSWIGYKYLMTGIMNSLGSNAQDAEDDLEVVLEYYRKTAALLEEAKEELASIYNRSANGEKFTFKIWWAPDFFDVIAAPLYNNTALTLHDKGKYEEALVILNQVTEIYKKTNNAHGLIINYNNIANQLSSLKRYKEAEEYYKKSIALVEEIRLKATGLSRKTYMQEQMTYYNNLMLFYIEQGDLLAAYKIKESSSAKFFKELLNKNITLPDQPDTIEKYIASIDKETCYISYRFTNGKNMGIFFITNQGIQYKQQSVRDYVHTIMQKYPGLDFTKYSSDVDLYYNYISNSTQQNIRGLKKKSDTNSGENTPSSYKDVSRDLYDFYLVPFENEMKKYKNIVFIPDDYLYFLPFETLISQDGSFLVEKFSVSYIHSLGIMQEILKREYSNTRKKILAFGNPVYEKVTRLENIEEIDLKNQNEVVSFINKVISDTDKGLRVDSLLGRLGIKEWLPLPGTEEEVNGIKKSVSGTKIITGKKLTEKTVKDMSEKGELASYKVLHFATHGISFSDLSDLSSLVLNQLNESSPEDGYLTIKEIPDLKLQADFVNLSACQTGLGQVFSGEGSITLSQSFIVSGANAASISLWSISDEATSLFMKELYLLAVKNEGRYREALNTIKRKFIADEKLNHPFYWAPFVYFGK